MIRRNLTVSLTVSVVSGIISDVGKTSSVCSDGICQRKEKWLYKEHKKKTGRAKYYNLLRVLAQSILPIARTLAEQNSLEFEQFPSTSPSRGQLNKRSEINNVGERSHRLLKRFENGKSFQVSSEFKLNEGITLSLKCALLF